MDNIRTRAWRLAQNKRNKHRGSSSIRNDFPREKNWKMMYTRSDKIVRAAQLGMAYPRVSNAQLTLKAMEEVTSA
ncbi:hypothetical protein [Pragia fontium]|uniref:Uncharacterized protein n=1 Tax=Pragia fontium DSM 5563 = ATCC 49100 TaxID=1122977 RepID=A0AAJ4W8Q9_9GAMM|nr:hypothetical protein [Pragia fontium]AKJ41669.1 hypothetical protein QQ39_05885 [Pragia fontium]SFC32859.1 hypothetical protein SAMN02745723_10288 [Pragia fontium DSM 5563 = ATCC 49100]SUB81897.1 Uncharacterised protein [Pragia fontium]VEJ54468.1 Uncharacterised protein [Pragia fontium]